MKILLITPESISNESSSGYLLRNLFSNFDNTQLAQIYFSSSTINLSHCKNFWRFANKDFYFNTGYCVSNDLVKNTEKKGFFSKYFIHLEPLLDLFPIKHSSIFHKWLDDFKPDIIYSWMGSKRIIDLTIYISKRNNVPIVIHFMDNWIEASLNRFYLLRILERKNLRQTINIINKHVTAGIVISESMLFHYNKIFQIPLYVISNGIHDNLVYDKFHNSLIKNNKIVFSLFGRLELGRLEILDFFLHSLQNITEYIFEINIYSDSEVQQKFSKTKNILLNYFDTPIDQDLFEIYTNTNFLLYIDGFNNINNINYFKYSFSGKIPLYLTSGKPVLSIGPLSNYSIEYLKSINIGPVVTNLDLEILINSVKEMINYENLDLKKIFNNSRIFVSNFKLSKIQTHFFNILSSTRN